MDEVDLPHVPRETGLSQVLTTLRAEGRAAVVMDRGTGAVVITLGDILRRWNALLDEGRAPDEAPMSGVTPRRSPPPRKILPARTLDIAGAEIGPQRAAAGAYLRGVTDPGYVVLATGGGRASVLTSSEVLAQHFGTKQTVCTCPTCRRSAKPHQLRKKGHCNYDGVRMRCG